MIRLYDYEGSGNCYKVRLLLAILGVACERVPIEIYPAREHKEPPFLAINPLGELPVIDDDGFVLRDSHAILAYLAGKHDPSGRWWPHADPAVAGAVMQWLAFAEGLSRTVGAARRHDTIFGPGDIAALRAGGHRLFRVLDEHLWFQEQAGLDWLARGAHPTIADVACFPYVMLSEEGGILRLPYPAIRRWADRVKRIPGFIMMPGIFDAGAAAA